jgi:hypothetical protein
MIGHWSLPEIGLDSRRNGEAKQAETLKWQIETIFSKGCAGMFVFAWTDEWWRGGYEIEDWDFGIVDRNRRTKSFLLRSQVGFEKNSCSVPQTICLSFPWWSAPIMALLPYGIVWKVCKTCNTRILK